MVYKNKIKIILPIKNLNSEVNGLLLQQRSYAFNIVACFDLDKCKKAYIVYFMHLIIRKDPDQMQKV